MHNSQVLTQTFQVRPWIKKALLVLGASGLIALFAQIRIPLPFTPVPVTMHTFAVLFLAAILGSKKGSLAALAYLAEGAIGLPVFSGGNSGLLYMAGATGGYLVGFIFAAYLTGWIIEKMKKNTSSVLVALLAGDSIIYLFGMLWLAQFVGGIKSAFFLGVFPFLIGSGVKILLSLSGIKTVRALKS